MKGKSTDDLLRSKIALESALAFDLHPAGLEPATLMIRSDTTPRASFAGSAKDALNSPGCNRTGHYLSLP